MSKTRNLLFKLLISCFLILPSIASAQVAVSFAQWTNVDNFKFCTLGNCETFRKVELRANGIEVGQNISIINLETGKEITNFLVKSIKFGRQVKMCWIGDSEGLSETYITVTGCRR